MIAKSWNVRDQTEKELKFQEEKLYTNIEAKYKLIKKVSEIEDAKKIIEEIWRMKRFANAIETELIRREYNNGTQKRSR